MRSVHIGIDYGVRKLAIAALPAPETGSGGLPVVFSAFWGRQPTSDELITEIVEAAEEQLDRHDITTAVVERPWMGRNPSTSMKLGMVAGALLYVCAQRADTALFVEPTVWKQRITGNSRADKAAVMGWLHRHHPQWDGLWSGDDEADALAMAIVASRTRRTEAAA